MKFYVSISISTFLGEAGIAIALPNCSFCLHVCIKKKDWYVWFTLLAVPTKGPGENPACRDHNSWSNPFEQRGHQNADGHLPFWCHRSFVTQANPLTKMYILSPHSPQVLWWKTEFSSFYKTDWPGHFSKLEDTKMY